MLFFMFPLKIQSFIYELPIVIGINTLNYLHQTNGSASLKPTFYFLSNNCNSLVNKVKCTLFTEWLKQVAHTPSHVSPSYTRD